LRDAEVTLRSLQDQGVIEVLVLSGEVHPQSARRSQWLQHIYSLCELALSLGFLPHTNAGPLSFAEMQRLHQVNVSMGLMVEQVTPQLMETVHRHARSKQPELRLQQLTWAGELRIPFTTGLLLGIGETASDRQETLAAIAQIHHRWGHIQEVILQPYSPGSTEAWQGSAFSSADLVQTVVIARQILPPEIAIQIPPNLIQSPQHLIDCLNAGAQDLGGISPHDEVNPDYAHPTATQLSNTLIAADWQLVRRLPIYPQYDHWVAPALSQLIDQWRDRLAGERDDRPTATGLALGSD
jgi:FO synthase subunit 1